MVTRRKACSLPSSLVKKKEKVPTIGVLARARQFQALLHSPGIESRADLARHLGVSRAWVTIVLGVLDVPGPLMDVLLHAEAAGNPVTEPEWRKVKRFPAGESVGRLRGMGYA